MWTYFCNILLPVFVRRVTFTLHVSSCCRGSDGGYDYHHSLSSSSSNWVAPICLVPSSSITHPTYSNPLARCNSRIRHVTIDLGLFTPMIVGAFFDQIASCMLWVCTVSHCMSPVVEVEMRAITSTTVLFSCPEIELSCALILNYTSNIIKPTCTVQSRNSAWWRELGLIRSEGESSVGAFARRNLNLNELS